MLLKAAVFTLTGILSTIVAQVLIYAGAGESWTMLLPLSNYLGMALAAFLPDAWLGVKSVPSVYTGVEKTQINHHGVFYAALMRLLDVPRPMGAIERAPPGTLTVPLPVYVLTAVVMDIFGFYLHVQGIKYAGSALFQVLYCSVVVWSALGYWFARTPFGSRFLLSLGFVELATPGEVAAGVELNTMQSTGIVMVLGGLAVTAFSEQQGPVSRSTLGVLYGLLCSVACAVCYGVVYTLAELLMSGPSPPRVQAVSARVGGGICVVLGSYILIAVLPRWGDVSLRVAEVGLLSPIQVIMGYAVMLCSALAHSVTYFQLMGQAGAVTTSIMQAARAVGVFLFSAFLFCSHNNSAAALAGPWEALKQESQCFSFPRGVATVSVVMGIIVYAYGKTVVKAHVVRKESSDEDVKIEKTDEK